jgi:hypothetical protein
MWLPMVMQGVSKRAVQWYSKCYCVASVKSTFTLEGVQAINDVQFVHLEVSMFSLHSPHRTFEILL